MAKNKHHFVPRFYLTGFESAPRRLNLYNLTNDLALPDVSLRDQCYKHRLYGSTDDVEDQLAVLEGHISTVLKGIISDRVLPDRNSEANYILTSFVSLQLLRTTAAAKRINVGIDKATKQAYGGDPRWADIDMESVRIGYKDPVLTSLRLLPDFTHAIVDLEMMLIESVDSCFITSDNPAFKYNQYCETIQDMGVTGALARGFQIFVPLSPAIYLILFDSGVYKPTSDRNGKPIVASEADVDMLNVIQIVSAERNLYFSKWERADEVRKLVLRTRRFRDSDPVRVVEYGADDDLNHSMLHEFDRMPDLKLKLAFLTLKRNARRVSLYDRARQRRKEISMPSLPEPPSLQGRTVKFSRFLGQR